MFLTYTPTRVDLGSPLVPSGTHVVPRNSLQVLSFPGLVPQDSDLSDVSPSTPPPSPPVDPPPPNPRLPVGTDLHSVTGPWDRTRVTNDECLTHPPTGPSQSPTTCSDLKGVMTAVTQFRTFPVQFYGRTGTPYPEDGTYSPVSIKSRRRIQFSPGHILRTTPLFFLPSMCRFSRPDTVPTLPCSLYYLVQQVLGQGLTTTTRRPSCAGSKLPGRTGVASHGPEVSVPASSPCPSP